jgi:hypothetical protein
MGSYWSERAGIYGVNLIIVGVSVMTVYGVLNLALVMGGALVH